MSLKRNPKGDFILRFRPCGASSPLTYHNLGPLTHGAAKDREAEIRAEAKRSRGLASPGTTFTDLAATWAELKRPNLAAATNRTAEIMLRLHILPVLGSLKVEDLLPVTIERYRAARLAAEKPPAKSTLNLEMRLVRWILNFGEEQGIVRNPIPRKMVKPYKLNPKTIYFQPEEWRAFIAAADADPVLREAAPLWRLKLYTASRISEMIDLRWSAVDLVRGSIAIGQKKTGRTKPLMLTSDMRAVLTSILPRGIGDRHVFTHGGLPWASSRLRHFFERTVGAAGLAGDWTPHSLRHTAATWARKAGVPLDRVAGMLGHAGLGLVLRYAHFAVEDLNPALDAVSAMEKRVDGRTLNVKGDFGQAGIDAGVYPM
jgi:integrase